MKFSRKLPLGISACFYLLFLFSNFYFLISISHASVDVACDMFHYPWCDTAKQTPAGLVNKIYLMGLGLAGAAAFGVLIYGAILYTVSAGNSSVQGDAKKWMEGALMGLGLLLGAYLILYTVNPDLVTLKNPEVKKAELPVSIQDAVENRSGLVNQTLSSNTVLNHKTGASLAKELGAQVKGGVSFEGVRLSTIDELRQLSTDFPELRNGSIYITSVTEGAHASGAESHKSGNKFDLRPNSSLDQFIVSNYQYIGTRGDGAKQYRSSRGTIYADEPQTGKPGDKIYQPRHWDVTVPTKT